MLACSALSYKVSSTCILDRKALPDRSSELVPSEQILQLPDKWLLVRTRVGR